MAQAAEDSFTIDSPSMEALCECVVLGSRFCRGVLGLLSLSGSSPCP